MGKFIYHPLVIIAFTTLGIIFYISLNESAKKTELSTKNIQVLEEEIHQISGEVIEIEEKIIETESEEFKEKIIRNELLLQKPNEYVIQLPSTENNTKTKADTHQIHKPIEKWIELIW